MARRCAISGKGPMSGNNVSHAKNRTKTSFFIKPKNSAYHIRRWYNEKN